MKKPHLITAGLLALAAIAAAQATTAAQSFIRVLEVAGEVQVAARDSSLANTVNWAPAVVSPSVNTVSAQVWSVPSGYKARVRHATSVWGSHARAQLNVGGTELEFHDESDLLGVLNGGLVLDSGDTVTAWFRPTEASFSYPVTANFLFTFELVEL